MLTCLSRLGGLNQTNGGQKSPTRFSSHNYCYLFYYYYYNYYYYLFGAQLSLDKCINNRLTVLLNEGLALVTN